MAAPEPEAQRLAARLRDEGAREAAWAARQRRLHRAPCPATDHRIGSLVTKPAARCLERSAARPAAHTPACMAIVQPSMRINVLAFRVEHRFGPGRGDRTPFAASSEARIAPLSQSLSVVFCARSPRSRANPVVAGQTMPGRGIPASELGDSPRFNAKPTAGDPGARTQRRARFLMNTGPADRNRGGKIGVASARAQRTPARKAGEQIREATWLTQRVGLRSVSR